MASNDNSKPRIVIIGCGFGGLEAARSLQKAALEITLIDRTNHHLFQPPDIDSTVAGREHPASP